MAIPAGLGIDINLIGGLFMRAEWEYVRFTERSKPPSTPCAPASATSSDRRVARWSAQSHVDMIGRGCCSVAPRDGGRHENLRRHQFGQLPEGEMGLRPAGAAL